MQQSTKRQRQERRMAAGREVGKGKEKAMGILVNVERKGASLALSFFVKFFF